MTGRDPVYVDPALGIDKFIIGGSVLNHARAGSRVWGAGVARIGDGVDPAAKIHAVRGPISRAVARAYGAECSAIYGDPALVLPRLYRPVPPKRRYAVGVVPHFQQAHLVRSTLAWTEHPEVTVIDIFAPTERFIDEICACDRIVSSALHGIVTAHAYGIPAAWVEFGESAIGGDGTKFLDCVRMGGDALLADIEALRALPYFSPRCELGALVDGLLGACPFEVTP